MHKSTLEGRVETSFFLSCVLFVQVTNPCFG